MRAFFAPLPRQGRRQAGGVQEARPVPHPAEPPGATSTRRTCSSTCGRRSRCGRCCWKRTSRTRSSRRSPGSCARSRCRTSSTASAEDRRRAEEAVGRGRSPRSRPARTSSSGRAAGSRATAPSSSAARAPPPTCSPPCRTSPSCSSAPAGCGAACSAGPTASRRICAGPPQRRSGCCSRTCSSSPRAAASPSRSKRSRPTSGPEPTREAVNRGSKSGTTPTRRARRRRSSRTTSSSARGRTSSRRRQPAAEFDLSKVKPETKAAVAADRRGEAQAAARPRARTRAETTFAQLGMDSLDAMEVTLAVEQRFGFTGDTVPTTLGELWALAEGLAGEGAAEAAAGRVVRPADRRQRRSSILGETVAEAFLNQAFAQPQDGRRRRRPRRRRDLREARRSARRRWPRGSARSTPPNVGLLLPASVACDLAFLGLHLAGKLPVVLNWTTGPANLAHAAKLDGPHARRHVEGVRRPRAGRGAGREVPLPRRPPRRASASSSCCAGCSPCGASAGWMKSRLLEAALDATRTSPRWCCSPAAARRPRRRCR